jgi:hypothetical protein
VFQDEWYKTLKRASIIQPTVGAQDLVGRITLAPFKASYLAIRRFEGYLTWFVSVVVVDILNMRGTVGHLKRRKGYFGGDIAL